MNSSVNQEIYANNINLLLSIIAELEDISNFLDNQIIVQRIRDVIINVNKVNSSLEKIRRDIQNLETNINQRFDNLDEGIKNIIINQGSIQTKEYPEGMYKGTIIDNKREGKGILKYNNGSKYEGNWKNDLKEGKGID